MVAFRAVSTYIGTANSHVVNVPTHEPGDLLVAVMVTTGQSTHTITGPTGWRTRPQMLLDAGSNVRLEVFFRLASDSEPASYTWTTSSTPFDLRAFMASYSDAGPALIGMAAGMTSTSNGKTIGPSTTVLPNHLTATAIAGNAASAITFTKTEAGDTERAHGSNSARGLGLYDSTTAQAAGSESRTWTSSPSTLAESAAVLYEVPSGAIAGNGPIAYRDSATVEYSSASSSYVVPKPAGTQTDDHILVFIARATATSSITTLPTGFIRINTVGNSNSGLNVLWKRAGASEPADYTFPLSTSATGWGVAVAYSGLNPNCPFGEFRIGVWSSGTSPVAQNVRIAGENSWCLAVGAGYNDTVSNSDGSDVQRVSVSTATQRVRVWDSNRVLAAGTETVTLTTTASSASFFMMELISGAISTAPTTGQLWPRLDVPAPASEVGQLWPRM